MHSYFMQNLKQPEAIRESLLNKLLMPLNCLPFSDITTLVAFAVIPLLVSFTKQEKTPNLWGPDFSIR